MARDKLEAVAHELYRQHPLQRLPSPSRGSSAALHAAGLASFSYSFSYLINNPSPINDSYGWHLQYLTILGLSLATLTFAVGLLSDLTLSRRLFALKNTLSVASAPMECLITILYWSLRALDPKLVLPDWSPPMDLPTDFTFHAAPSIALVIDLLFFSPPYTIAFVPAFGLSGVIAVSYWAWVERCYIHNQFYPYPLFAVLNTYQRAGLFASSALLMTLSTAFLIWLYGIVNGTRVRQLAKEHFKLKERPGSLKGE